MLIAILVLIWQTDSYSFLLLKIFPAKLEVKITDENNETVIGAKGNINGIDKISDNQGLLIINNLHAGTYKLLITTSGFDNYEEKIKLKKGVNNKLVQLRKTIVTDNVSITTKNYINGQTIKGVKIKILGEERETDEKGIALFEKIAIDDHKVTIEKEGYNKIEKNIIFSDNKDQVIEIVPSGKLYFVSNRDGGKKGVYLANYDGTELSQLVKRLGEGEDYNAQSSPDKNWVVFMSTRDQEKKADGTFRDYIYLIKSSGESLKKIGNQYSINGVRWSSDNKYIAWIGKEGQDDSSNKLYIYNVTSESTIKLAENGGLNSFAFSFSGKTISWIQNTIYGDINSEKGTYIYRFSNNSTKKITDSSVSDLKYSQDNQYLLYSYYDTEESKTLYKQYNIETGNISNYTPDSANSRRERIFTQDGNIEIFKETRDGKTDLFLKEKSTNVEKNITNLGTVSGDFYFVNNENYIIFSSVKTAETANYITSTGSSIPKKIVDVFLTQNYFYPEGY